MDRMIVDQPHCFLKITSQGNFSCHGFSAGDQFWIPNIVRAIGQALAEEFFAGSGARSDVMRTIFVVGDRKQSIFSFQGADPAAFEEARQ